MLSTGSRVLVGFRTFGSWALECSLGRCDLPGSGIEPVSPASAGGFFSTEPRGKPCHCLFIFSFPPTSFPPCNLNKLQWCLVQLRFNSMARGPHPGAFRGNPQGPSDDLQQCRKLAPVSNGTGARETSQALQCPYGGSVTAFSEPVGPR